MNDALFANFLFYLVTAIVGAIMARLTLIWFDKSLVQPAFKEWLNNAPPMVKAVYYSTRFFAVFYLFAAILG